MEVPLVLHKGRDGALVYSVSWFFRALMALILALVAAALFTDGGAGGPAPGPVGWIVIAVLALGTLYEESWRIEPVAGRLVHRSGLLILARSKALALDTVDRFRIVPFVRGTLPGSADEAAQNAAALAGARGDDSGKRRAWHTKSYLCLIVETSGGERYSIDVQSARKATALKAIASRMAGACGKELLEGQSGSE